MALKRYADAVWAGDLQSGKGSLSTPQSGLFEGQNYSFKTRFGDEKGTNPEELLAVAHAGCFTMALSLILGDAGFTADSLETRADVTLEKIGDSFAIVAVHLTLRGKVPGIAADAFDDLATKARVGCPVSKLVKAVVTLDARLID